MPNCSNCSQKHNLIIGMVFVEFDCPTGKTVLQKKDYGTEFKDEECRFYKKEVSDISMKNNDNQGFFINVEVLGWTDICCGCRSKIPSTDKVYMLSGIAGVKGSIHLCATCINNISKSQEIDDKEKLDSEDI